MLGTRTLIEGMYQQKTTDHEKLPVGQMANPVIPIALKYLRNILSHKYGGCADLLTLHLSGAVFFINVELFFDISYGTFSVAYLR